ncbi:MAG: TraB/GumN family protein, partial [Chitinophagaceae bacterium]
MKRTLILFPVILLLISTAATAQTSKPWPKTLLWRISGNGLKGNSYLFGTMHLEDKRIFNFTDSLYQYLEQADGYAMEVDLQEFADSVFQKVLDQREDEIIDEKRLAKKSDKTKIIDSLMDNVLTKNDKASKKQLELIRKYKTHSLTKHHEMPTIMDAYLYGIARREGKWVGGIEDIQDQLFLFDELGRNMTHKEFSASDDETSATLEKMISIYQANDLEQVEKFSLHDTPTEWEDKLLTKRNIKMAARMDSLSAIRKMFFAVGAAHLPGQGGVINLLRKKGFSVDPVFSTTTIDPVKYSAHLNSIPWIKAEDEAKTYQVEMPGKPSDLNMFNNFIKMKLYVDISTMTYFLSGSVIAAASVDMTKITDALSKNTDATIFNKRIIDKDDVKGIECVMTTGGYFYKVQYLYRDNRLFIMMAGGETIEKTETPDVNKFFNSMVINKA